jgi:RES domain
MRGFPQCTIVPDTTLWRIHRARHDVWYFRNDGVFRFDLVGNPQHGTCYFAEDPLGAFVETLQNFRGIPLPRIELVARKLFSVEFRLALTLADLTDNAAANFDLDASIFAGSPEDYSASQEFARDAYDAGFAGVRYRVRHDMRQDLIGVALFGPLGAHSGAALPPGTDEDIPESVVASACTDIGFRVRGPLLEPA